MEGLSHDKNPGSLVNDDELIQLRALQVMKGWVDAKDVEGIRRDMVSKLLLQIGGIGDLERTEERLDELNEEWEIDTAEQNLQPANKAAEEDEEEIIYRGGVAVKYHQLDIESATSFEELLERCELRSIWNPLRDMLKPGITKSMRELLHKQRAACGNDFFLTQFDREMSFYQVLSELEKLGLEPANFFELIAFCSQIKPKNNTVALGKNNHLLWQKYPAILWNRRLIDWSNRDDYSKSTRYLAKPIKEESEEK